MMSSFFTSIGVFPSLLLGEQPLPSLIDRRVRIFAGQSIRQLEFRLGASRGIDGRGIACLPGYSVSMRVYDFQRRSCSGHSSAPKPFETFGIQPVNLQYRSKYEGNFVQINHFKEHLSMILITICFPWKQTPDIRRRERRFDMRIF
jgi:hypothetical protein